MLTEQENDILAHVGPRTPMGAVLRRFWIPFLQSAELAEADGEPVRLTLLGEKLLAFRDTDGRVGLVDRLCAHRRADLFFGRNEECGLRCTYHGWKYDVDGACVDMPNEPDESNFKDRIHLKAYPVRERAGILWAYMGPKDEPQAEMPTFEWSRLPDDHLITSWSVQETNFVQGVEGGIDSSHINFLHSSLDAYRQTDGWRERIEGQPRREGTRSFAKYVPMDKKPRMYALDTDYGVVIGSGRKTEDGSIYWRINQFWMPFYTSPPGDPGFGLQVMFVPIDDVNTARWIIQYRTDRSWSKDEIERNMAPGGVHASVLTGMHQPLRRGSGELPTRHYMQRNMSNDYQVDRVKQRTETFTGIIGVDEQDSAIQEGMGALIDRTEEHLGTTDVGIIRMRRMLLRAADELMERGAVPHAASHGDVYNVRAGHVVLPADASWVDDPAAVAAVTPTSDH